MIEVVREMIPEIQCGETYLLQMRIIKNVVTISTALILWKDGKLHPVSEKAELVIRQVQLFL